MKIIFNKIVFITLILWAIASCKKDPDPNVASVIIAEENLTIDFTTVLFEGVYEYPTELNEIKLYLSNSNNMANATEYSMELEKKQFNILINNLLENTDYYYLYEFVAGITSIKSNVKSFKTKDYGLLEVTTCPVNDISNKDAFCGGRGF